MNYNSGQYLWMSMDIHGLLNDITVKHHGQNPQMLKHVLVHKLYKAQWTLSFLSVDLEHGQNTLISRGTSLCLDKLIHGLDCLNSLIMTFLGIDFSKTLSSTCS